MHLISFCITISCYNAFPFTLRHYRKMRLFDPVALQVYFHGSQTCLRTGVLEKVPFATASPVLPVRQNYLHNRCISLAAASGAVYKLSENLGYLIKSGLSAYFARILLLCAAQAFSSYCGCSLVKMCVHGSFHVLSVIFLCRRAEHCVDASFQCCHPVSLGRAWLLAAAQRA